MVQLSKLISSPTLMLSILSSTISDNLWPSVIKSSNPGESAPQSKIVWRKINKKAVIKVSYIIKTYPSFSQFKQMRTIVINQEALNLRLMIKTRFTIWCSRSKNWRGKAVGNYKNKMVWNPKLFKLISLKINDKVNEKTKISLKIGWKWWFNNLNINI